MNIGQVHQESGKTNAAMEVRRKITQCNSLKEAADYLAWPSRLLVWVLQLLGIKQKKRTKN